MVQVICGRSVRRGSQRNAAIRSFAVRNCGAEQTYGRRTERNCAFRCLKLRQENTKDSPRRTPKPTGEEGVEASAAVRNFAIWNRGAAKTYGRRIQARAAIRCLELRKASTEDWLRRTSKPTGEEVETNAAVRSFAVWNSGAAIIVIVNALAAATAVARGPRDWLPWPCGPTSVAGACPSERETAIQRFAQPYNVNINELRSRGGGAVRGGEAG